MMALILISAWLACGAAAFGLTRRNVRRNTRWTNSSRAIALSLSLALAPLWLVVVSGVELTEGINWDADARW